MLQEYVSDRDVFLFFVDDTNPIEAGRLPNGEPNLYFRGFYCWNIEVGSKTLGIAALYQRAVCMNLISGRRELRGDHDHSAQGSAGGRLKMPNPETPDSEMTGPGPTTTCRQKSRRAILNGKNRD